MGLSCCAGTFQSLNCWTMCLFLGELVFHILHLLDAILTEQPLSKTDLNTCILDFHILSSFTD